MDGDVLIVALCLLSLWKMLEAESERKRADREAERAERYANMLREEYQTARRVEAALVARIPAPQGVCGASVTSRSIPQTEFHCSRAAGHSGEHTDGPFGANWTDASTALGGEG